jgi:hypothetical protein
MVVSIFTYSKQTVKRTVNRYISWLQVTIQARRQRDAAISREIDGLEEYVPHPVPRAGVEKTGIISIISFHRRGFFPAGFLPTLPMAVFRNSR